MMHQSTVHHLGVFLELPTSGPNPSTENLHNGPSNTVVAESRATPLLLTCMPFLGSSGET